MTYVSLPKRIHTYAFVGPRGMGKTATITHFASAAQQAGADVYANYKLNFPHTLVEDTHFHEKIPSDGKPKFLAFDDFRSTSKGSYHDREFRRFFTMMRKFVSENVTTCLSTPLYMQYSRELLLYVDYLVSPVELLFNTENNFEPGIVELYFIPLVLGRPNYFEAWKEPVVIDGVGSLYNTKDAPLMPASGNYKKVWDKFKNYAHTNHPKSFLVNLISQNFTWSNEECKNHATMLKMGWDPYKKEIAHQEDLIKWGSGG